MPARIKLGSQRAEIARMLIAMMRTLSHGYFKNDHFGSSVGDSLICSAIYIGQIERRPMSASKLATYTGMPRATVIRRLQMLIDAGRVVKLDGHFALPVEYLNSEDVVASINEATKIIHRAAVNLSKMDTERIAHANTG